VAEAEGCALHLAGGRLRIDSEQDSESEAVPTPLDGRRHIVLDVERVVVRNARVERKLQHVALKPKGQTLCHQGSDDVEVFGQVRSRKNDALRRRQQHRNEPRDSIFAVQRQRPGLLLGDRAGSTFLLMVEPTEVNANRFARLLGGQISLD
jgi:hypothetical protein